MSYSYFDEKPKLLTDEGQRILLRVRDRARQLIKTAGAVRQAELFRDAIGSSDSWQDIACVDRLVELGELEELVPRIGHTFPTQFRVFIGHGALTPDHS